MKKIINPIPSGGYPFFNNTFTDILQTDIYSSISGMYSYLNSNSLVGNTGIIINGITITAQSLTSLTINFDSNALVYIGGEFLNTNLLGSQTYGFGTIWITASADEVEQYVYQDGIVRNTAISKKFQVVTTLPTSGQFIEISFLNGCSRFLDMVMFNRNNSVGAIFEFANLLDFNTITGLGRNKFQGWALCDGRNGTVDKRGRVAVGFDYQGNATPTTAPSKTQTNTGALGNVGGVNTVQLVEVEGPLRQHTHILGGGSGSGSNPAGVGGVDANIVVSRPGQYSSSGVVPSAGGLDAIESHENRMPYIVSAFIQKIN